MNTEHIIYILNSKNIPYNNNKHIIIVGFCVLCTEGKRVEIIMGGRSAPMVAPRRYASQHFNYSRKYLQKHWKIVRIVFHDNGDCVNSVLPNNIIVAVAIVFPPKTEKLINCTLMKSEKMKMNKKSSRRIMTVNPKKIQP